MCMDVLGSDEACHAIMALAGHILHHIPCPHSHSWIADRLASLGNLAEVPPLISSKHSEIFCRRLLAPAGEPAGGAAECGAEGAGRLEGAHAHAGRQS